MPFSTGTYSAPASSWNPAVADTDIDVSDWTALLADITTALSTCILKDGTQTTTAAIPFATQINSTATTESTSTTTGAIKTAGGMGIAKTLFVNNAKTAQGTVNMDTATATTLFAVATTGLYLALVYVKDSAVTTYQGYAVIVTNNNSQVKIAASNSDGSLTFSISGTNFQAAQATGGNQDVNYVYIKIA